MLGEPTVGLGPAPLNHMVDAGRTVILIEHHLDLIKTADQSIPVGGPVVATSRARRRTQ
jgi:excinuclease UvrABC ATPase subunit